MIAGLAAPLPLMIPGGTPASAAGKLLLVEDKILTADATTVTFSGLAGETDKLYLLTGRIKVNTGGAIHNFSLRPNGTTVGLQSGWTRTSFSTVSYSGGSGASATIGQGNNAAADSTTFALWIHANRLENAVAQMRYFHGTGAQTDNAGPVAYGSLIFGAWTNTADEITSLDITALSANAIRNGSRFTLYKVGT